MWTSSTRPSPAGRAPTPRPFWPAGCSPTTRPTPTSGTPAWNSRTTSGPARSRTSPTCTSDEGWLNYLPQGLLDNLIIDGKLYSVPVNIHRSNLMWYSPATLQVPRHRGAAEDLGGVPHPGRDPQGARQDRPVPRPGLDPEAPAGDGAARRTRRRPVRRAVERSGQLELDRGHRGAEPVQAGPGVHRPQVSGRRLAAAGRPASSTARRSTP